MRAHLLEIHVENFRALRRPVHLTLTHPTGAPLSRVVLAGPNGSGKTSLLEAILIALGREDLVVRDLPAAERNDHWRTGLPPGARIELRGHTSPEHATDPTQHGEFRVIRTADRWEVRHGPGEGRVTQTDVATIRALLSRLEVEYFSSWRAPILPGGLQPASRGRPPEDTETNRLRRLKQRIINERARRAFESKPPTSQTPDQVWLDRINKVWTAFHSDGSLIDAGLVDENADELLFDLFVFDGAARRCSIDQVSSGELELLALAGTLMLGEFAGILLIDEPELHLHREWQSRLIDTLTAMAPQAQLILATHADAPWDQVFSFERFFLARPDDPRTPPQPPAAGKVA